jgi:hypothetical protein
MDFGTLPTLTQDQIDTVNRAIGYCQALWYTKQHDSLTQCKIRAMEMYALKDFMMIGIFFEILNDLIPSAKDI